MNVRKAGRDDLIAIGQIAYRASWEACKGLLPADAIADALSTRYSPTALKRRLLAGALLVCVDDRDHIIGFADYNPLQDRVCIESIFLDDPGRLEAGELLIAEIRGVAGCLPVATDIILGNLEGEHLHESAGFVPGEVVQAEFGGHDVVRRRWWLGPLVASLGGTSL